MTSEKILQADMLDILFENRNKKYGAYALRKDYNNRMYKAIGLICLLALTLILFSFVKKDNAPKEKILFETKETELATPPKDKPIPPVPPKPPVAQQPVASAPKTPMPSQTWVTPVITTSVADKIHNLDSSAISNVTVKVPASVPPVVPSVPDVPPGPPATPEPPAIGHVTPTAFADVMPSFPGGNEALKKFLQRNLVSPNDMQEGESVTVKIRFVVGFDGAIKSFETVQDGGYAYNNEVMRVLKKMPAWIPGKTRGENVSVYYVLPVKFTPAE